MAIVREYGKPDAFITMTCNPNWVEIIVLLPDDQTAQDRPDIVARVWQLKLKAKVADLDEGLLGCLGSPDLRGVCSNKSGTPTITYY
ncbi:unnamed protein product [Phytophthora fragariaefolia]|uniref:Unnamed protein product n=1 Tax=Phytophthora fragariaefolia TaxID=1490495 RepID=A0A9W6U1P0_9STRA|nr:unnamed protein product [Phytophthora fragariaefolia]